MTEQNTQAGNSQTQNTQPNENAITEDMNAFYERADEFIKLANELRTDSAHAGKINASMLYATARFSAWVAATGFVKGADYAKEKQDIIDHFTKGFAQMLSEHIDDYAENFQKYMQIGKQS